MRGRCVGDAWEMRGRCVGDAWEVQLEDLPLPQHVVREYEAVGREQPTPAQ